MFKVKMLKRTRLVGDDGAVYTPEVGDEVVVPKDIAESLGRGGDGEVLGQVKVELDIPEKEAAEKEAVVKPKAPAKTAGKNK